MGEDVGAAVEGTTKEKGAGEGEDVEAAVEHHDSAGCRGLPEIDVNEGPVATENGNHALAPPSELRHAVGDVNSDRNFHNVAPEHVRAVSGDEYRRFRLVSGARWTSPRAARGGDVNSSLSWLVAVFSVLIFFSYMVPRHRTLVHGKPQIRFFHRVARVL